MKQFLSRVKRSVTGLLCGALCGSFLATVGFAPLAGVVLLTSCATTSQPDIVRIAAAVEEAARFGTQEALRDRPDWRPTFLLVRDQLTAIAARDKLTVSDLLDAVSLLPITELSSDGARIAFAAARLTIALANWSDVEVIATEQVRPVVEALAKGMTAGLNAADVRSARVGGSFVPAKTSPKYYKAK